MKLSVIICTHNPRPEYLRRVLEALRSQTLSKERWELLLIDNASNARLSGEWDLSWHSQARHVREDEPGLTPARLRGIKESKGESLVFVDDDNVLARDYLENVLVLGAQKPWVGAWSAGNIEPEYEVAPAAWLGPFLRFLALNNRQREVWSNDYDSGLLPIGAGMAIQCAVGLNYARHLEEAGGIGRALDRVGNSLLAAGDTDIGLCTCEIGLACGHAPTLRVTHLIPRGRVKRSYLARLARDVTRSHQILFMGYGLVQLNRAQTTWQLAVAFLLLPWNSMRSGRGSALLRLVQRWADLMAIADYERLRELGGVTKAKDGRTVAQNWKQKA